MIGCMVSFSCKVIEQTRAFLEAGQAPQRGIDDVDRLLMRKRYLMGKCGIAESHRLTEAGDVLRPGVLEAAAEAEARKADEETTAALSAAAAAKEQEELGDEIDLDADQHVSNDEDELDDMDLLDDIDDILDGILDGDLDLEHGSSSQSEEETNKQLFVRTAPSDKLVLSAALMCAVRVSVMNETDVDLLCPRARGAWDDHKCEDEIFTEYQVCGCDSCVMMWGGVSLLLFP